MVIHTAIVRHEHGVNAYVGITPAYLYQQLYEYVCEWWHEEGLGGDPKDMSHEEAVSTYFNNVNEWLDVDTAIMNMDGWLLCSPKQKTKPVEKLLRRCFKR